MKNNNYENRTVNKTYANYLNYWVQYRMDTHTFELKYTGKGCFAREVKIEGLYNADGEKVCGLEAFPEAVSHWEERSSPGDTRLTVYYSRESGMEAELVLCFIVDRNGICCEIQSGKWIPRLIGALDWGKDMQTDTFAVCLDRKGSDLRCAFGPAASEIDNALFDRADGTALEITQSDKLRLNFCWETKTWRFTADGNRLAFFAHSRIFEHMFKTPYKPINKNHAFPSPPAGWMTWYAVQFNACEKTVLENARFMKEHFADFGANVIWVDWEWYHSVFTDQTLPPDDINFFYPDPIRYPNGLGYIADEIRKLGQIPAIWIGPTNEPAPGAFIQNHPESMLAYRRSWCGAWFFDLSHPDFLNEYLPAAIAQIKAWGYEAVKWDCLPISLQFADQYHEYMSRPELTSEEALRMAVQKVRELLGEDYYMLSCSGDFDRAVTAAIDLFDGARIGGDIFTWPEFIHNFISRIYRFYSYHNTQIYCDPDNLVVRPEHNTADEAVSRASFLTLLGLPVTLGDHLPDLPADRVDLLKRAMPALDAHPMDIREGVHDGKTIIANLAVNRPFEQWNVADILNLSEEETAITLDFSQDLHLSESEYLVFDYWNNTFLGVLSHSVDLTLRPHASVVLSLHAAANHPQIVSTSRHISQGAVDLLNVVWDAGNKILYGKSSMVKDDPYTLTVWDPALKKLCAKTIMPEKTGESEWQIEF
jgi:hypothetical protein